MTAAALVLFVVRLTGIIAIAAIAAIARRRAAAAEQHVIWMMALAGALVLPFAHVALPEWRIGPTVTPLHRFRRRHPWCETAASPQQTRQHRPTHVPSSRQRLAPIDLPRRCDRLT